VAFEHAQAATALDIPQKDRTVTRARKRTLAIGTPRHAKNSMLVAFEHLREATAIDVPQSDGIVL
jgi:hypothetical protein